MSAIVRMPVLTEVTHKKELDIILLKEVTTLILT